MKHPTEQFNQIPVSCGLDVHKSVVVACLLDPSNGIHEKRKYSTMTADLEKLRDWLVESNCTRVAMESTGQYWKPIFNILEEAGLGVILANPRHVKNLPGRKTDMSDCEWLAVLNLNGLIRGSFIPPRPIRELRDLCRLRYKLIGDRTRIKNRISDFVEDANIKISSVVSDLFGVSGLAMLRIIAAGEQNPQIIANLARGRLKSKQAELQKAAYGRISEHHRTILTYLLQQLDEIQEMLREVELMIVEKSTPYEEQIKLLCTIPGVDYMAAVIIISEIGIDMSVFPSDKHISSWAGLCPGNNESAGKKFSGRIPKGNRYLKAVLCQVAWAAAKTKDAYYSRKYWSLKARRGAKKAIVAIAHKILVAIYHILEDMEPYRELGPDYLDKFKGSRTISIMVRKLRDLGYTVAAPDKEQPLSLSNSP